jgi:hypothetical protein
MAKLSLDSGLVNEYMDLLKGDFSMTQAVNNLIAKEIADIKASRARIDSRTIELSESSIDKVDEFGDSTGKKLVTRTANRRSSSDALTVSIAKVEALKAILKARMIENKAYAKANKEIAKQFDAVKKGRCMLAADTQTGKTVAVNNIYPITTSLMKGSKSIKKLNIPQRLHNAVFEACQLEKFNSELSFEFDHKEYPKERNTKSGIQKYIEIGAYSEYVSQSMKASADKELFNKIVSDNE